MENGINSRSRAAVQSTANVLFGSRSFRAALTARITRINTAPEILIAIRLISLTSLQFAYDLF